MWRKNSFCCLVKRREETISSCRYFIWFWLYKAKMLSLRTFRDENKNRNLWNSMKEKSFAQLALLNPAVLSSNHSISLDLWSSDSRIRYEQWCCWMLDVVVGCHAKSWIFAVWVNRFFAKTFSDYTLEVVLLGGLRKPRKIPNRI